MTQNLAYTVLELSSMGLKKLLYIGIKEAAYIQEGKKKGLEDKKGLAIKTWNTYDYIYFA